MILTITHETVVDSQGNPAAALIPWSEFLLLQEILEGGDVTAEETKSDHPVGWSLVRTLLDTVSALPGNRFVFQTLS